MEPKQEHKLISHADILLIVGILILAVAGLFAWKKLETPGAYVDIMIDGKSVKTLRLDQDASYEVKQQAGVNTVVVQDGSVTVQDADCPDKICVKHRAINRTGETIICLPHKLVVEIEEVENSDDSQSEKEDLPDTISK